MATSVPDGEILNFFEFLGRRLLKDSGSLTPEQSVREFRQYEAELHRFIDGTQPALEESRRGQSKPLDVAGLMARVRARLTPEESGA